MFFRRKEFALFIAFVLGCISLTHAQVCHSFEPNANDVVHVHKALSTDSIGLADTENYDIVYHRLSVKLDPAVRYIQGSVTSYFRPVTSLSQMSFDMMDSLHVDSVYYTGVRLTTFTHSDNSLTITFPHSISTLDSVVVYYQGVPPNTGFGSFENGKHFNGTDSVPIVWTLSEPYGARDWWPCKMTLTDKIDSLDTYVNVPTGNRAGSNGLMNDSVVTGNTTTYHWRERYPIATYLVGIAVTNYASHSFNVPTQYGDVTVLNYFYPEQEAVWAASDSDLAKALNLYSDFFGPYPFIKEKYGQAQFGWGGGMEHQTMSFVAGINFDLNVHEMAHQWFGDKLTCDSWSEIWLNEGFAVFLTGLCYEHFAAPVWWYTYRRVNLDRTIRGENKTVFCDDTTSVPRIFDNYITYSKGAYLLHMLRGQLGDAAFFRALKNYITDPALEYNFSKTDLLKAHLEAESGQDLTVFFNQWFYNGGYPSYALDWSQNGAKVSLKLSQASSNPSVHFFTMPVPIKLYGGGMDTTMVLQHTFSGQEFMYQIPFGIDSAVIDPELWLISANNTVRKLPALDRDNFLMILTNPVRDNLTIWYDSKNIKTVNISMYNTEGQKVLSDSAPQGNGDYYSTAVSGLPAGAYIAKVVTEKGTHTQRIVKY